MSIFSKLISLLFFYFIFVHFSFAQNSCSFQLENADFESPVITGGLAFITEDKLSGWETTAPDNTMELWGSGFQGVPAYSGKQFIEINASYDAAIFNDATSVPGTTIKFGFAHRGRQGTDVIELKIGAPGGPYTSYGIFSTGNTAWKFYTVDYTVPVGQHKTRFMFEVVSSVGGPSIGNFLDNINVVDIDIEMNAIGSSVCGENKGKIEITGSKPDGVNLEYSIDNVKFQSSNVFENLPLGTYKVYMRANGTCIRNKTVTIPASSGLKVDLGKDIVLCEGESVVLDPKIQGLSYLWSTGETTSSIEVNESKNYSVTVTDANNCNGTDEINVTVNPIPKVNLGNDTTICEGTTLKIDSKINNAKYKWSNNQNTSSITVNSAGKYFIELTDSKGCLGYDTVEVNIQQKPTVNLGNDMLICPTETLVLDAQINNVSYLWNTGETTKTIIAKNTGVYSVEVTDIFDCKARSSVNIKAKINLNLGNDTTICIGTNLVLNAKNNGMFYDWNTGENTQSITVNKAGKYLVEVSDGLGCKIYDSVMVFVDSIINPYVNLDTTFCQGEILALQKHQNSYNLEWVNYPNQSQITINSSGKYKAVLSNQLCKDTFEVNVNILDTLKASIVHLGDLDVYCFKTETASLKILIEDPTNYTSIWMHNSSREIEIEVTEPGIYTAQVSNGTCISIISTNVVEHCKPLFFVPNAFTPNNDDLNDVFMPQHSGLFQEYKMEIFNRWGELIYTTNELNTGWDGKIAGKDIQADVFVYKIYFSYLNEKDFLHRENLVGTVTMYR